jgi:hypothetical protein
MRMPTLASQGVALVNDFLQHAVQRFHLRLQSFQSLDRCLRFAGERSLEARQFQVESHEYPPTGYVQTAIYIASLSSRLALEEKMTATPLVSDFFTLRDTALA